MKSERRADIEMTYKLDRRVLRAGWLIVLLVLAGGCVSIDSQREVGVGHLPEPERVGVYHKVKKSETLWRIAKTYNVSIGDIIRVNNIPKAAKIEKDQLVFIPGVVSVKEVVAETDDSQNEFIWPVQGKVIRYFHERNGEQVSKGIDIRAQEGTEVKAARTGRVVFADYLSGYGFTVILDHSDGFHSVYARNSKLLVKLDDYALKDTAIAQVGRSSNLAYLHFEIRKNAIEDNPLFYLP